MIMSPKNQEVEFCLYQDGFSIKDSSNDIKLVPFFFELIVEWITSPEKSETRAQNVNGMKFFSSDEKKCSQEILLMDPNFNQNSKKNVTFAVREMVKNKVN